MRRLALLALLLAGCRTFAAVVVGSTLTLAPEAEIAMAQAGARDDTLVETGLAVAALDLGLVLYLVVTAPEAPAASGPSGGGGGSVWGGGGGTTAPCMYDAASNAYEQCNALDGVGHCDAFGAGCTADSVGGSCMYDAKTNAYEVCNAIDGVGHCDAFGAGCAPAGGTPCMYDAASNAYEQCNAIDGVGHCDAFGAGCTP